MLKDLLFGHTDFESAFVVDDYPYGRKLRTVMRYWIETSPKHGDRLVRQSVNPKTGRLNKPKKSTYSEVLVMGLDENGHVKTTGLSFHAKPEFIAEWLGKVGQERLSDAQRKQVGAIIGLNKAMEGVTWTVVEQGTYNLSEPGELERLRADNESPERKAKDAEQEQIKHAIAVKAAHEAGESLRKLQGAA